MSCMKLYEITIDNEYFLGENSVKVKGKMVFHAKPSLQFIEREKLKFSLVEIRPLSRSHRFSPTKFKKIFKKKLEEE